MSEPTYCPDCGAVIPESQPKGLCARCALLAALGQGGDSSQTTASIVGPELGERIGRYKLLEKIGEGGCGVVYMAEQEEPVRRRVALKVIKPGMDTREIVARFEAERQALALMDHPNIARVFDGGATDSGRPYFVMELVRGTRITRYCDDAKLSTRDRLNLFIQVCQAVQHAHQKGIIHRDLKPSNILITVNDGQAVPKVIDFGIVKALGQRLTDKTLFTQFRQLIGTPAYMSPEQAEMTSVDTDTRSDIYSLGVLLYELLTGRTPFDSKKLLKCGLEEMLRTIRESDPPRPSARLSTMGVEERTTVAQQRQADVPRLTHQIRGDLDWIVMKCLEKDRARRYESANGLIQDIGRHLALEPVLACPPTAAYRARTFIRRNRVLVSSATAIALILLLGIGVSTWMWQRAELARAAALEKAEAENRAKLEAQQARSAERMAADKERQAHVVADNARLAAEKALHAETEQRQRAEYEAYLAQISLAAAKIDNREFASAEALLDACPALYRHWEWGRLKRLCHSELATIQAERRLGRVVLSEDGGTVFTFDYVECTRWDSSSAKELARFDWSTEQKKMQNGFVYQRAIFRELFFFEKQERALLISQGGSGSSFCDLKNGVRISDLNFSDFPMVSCAALSPDGRLILAGSQHAFVKMFDAQTGKELFKLPVLGSEMPNHLGKGLEAVAFSPDGRRFLTGGSFAIQVWDTANQKELLRFNEDDPVTGRRPLKLNYLQRAWFSHDGRRIISSGPETVRIWDAETGHEAMRLGKDRLSLRAFSTNGNWILTSSEKALQVWNLADGTVVKKMSGSAGRNPSVGFSPDERLIVAVGEDRKVRIWDAATGTNFTTIEGHQGAVNSAVVSVDGSQILTTSDDRTARLWDVKTGRELMVFSGHSQPVTAGMFCADGEHIVTTGKDKSAKVWSTHATNQGLRLKVSAGALGPGTFSPDGKQILTLDASAPPGQWREAKLWDAGTGRRLHRFRFPKASVRSAQFTPDGSLVVVKGWVQGPADNSGAHQRIGLWEAESGQRVTTVPEMTNAWDTADLSPDGRWFFGATGLDAAIWDVKTGQRVCALKGFENDFGRAVFSPDGPRLMTSFGYRAGFHETVEMEKNRLMRGSAKEFPVIKLWNYTNGVEVCAVKFYQSSLERPVFTPDSRNLATFGFNTCHLWSPEFGNEVRQFKAHHGIVSRDSKRLFGTTFDWNLCIFDLESGNPVVSGPGHREEARVTSISSDGKRFLTSSVDGTAKLWDAATARELLTFKTSVGRHSDPVFSPDDRQILITIDGAAVLLEAMDWKSQSPGGSHE